MTKTGRRSRIADFFVEMRRRHVVRFALGYAAAAFVVLQLAEIVMPAFGLGEGALRVLVIMVALGFPPATVLAWIFDITAEGIQRTEGAGADTVLPRLALLVVTVGVMSGLGVWLAARGAFSGQFGTAGGAVATPVVLAEYDPSAPIRSIAVLPLEDFSAEGGQAYFTAGMHDELIAKLSQMEDVRVVSRTSVMQYAGTTKSAPQIGRELGVDALIEGSVTREGDQVRVTLQIIHAASDSHIQTLQFDREVTNVLALQTEIAHAVVHEISSKHDESEFTQVAMNVAPAAQEAYLRGRFEFNKGTAEGYESAMGLFEDAVAVDPDFAPALAGLASARFMVDLDDGELDPATVELARGAAMRALEADTGSVEAMEVLSFIERSVPRVMPVPPVVGGRTPSVRVVRVPGTSDSIVMDLSSFDTTWVGAMTSLGHRMEETVRARTFNLNGDTDHTMMIARQLMGAGRFGEAADLLTHFVGEAPEAAAAWEMLARAQVSAGDARRAHATIRRWSETGAEGAPSPQSVEALGRAVAESGSAGYWGWTRDRLMAEADEGGSVVHTDLAAALAGAGDEEAAIAELSLALRRGEPELLTLRTDPVWDDLRDDERFAQIVRAARALRFSPAVRRPPEERSER